MSSRCVVRSAAVGDVPLIVALIKELAAYERAPECAVATEADLRAALFGARPACEALIGEVDGEGQGFALFFTNFSTWLGKPGIYLEDLFVRPGCRGCGLGKLLFGGVCAAAASRGAGRIEWRVLDWNTPAHEFYRKAGATPLDEWTEWRLSGDAIAACAARLGNNGIKE